MAWFWFLAGAITALAVLLALLPWIARQPRLRALSARPWPAAAAGLAFAGSLLVASHWLPGGGSRSDAAGSFGEAMTLVDRTSMGASADAAMPGAAAVAPGTAPAAAERASAGSMDSAIGSLEARLAKGGGSAGDWELLARAFEFEGRPDDAAEARAHRLPPWPPAAAAAGTAARAPLATVGGDVVIAPSLAGRAARGETLFIFATDAAAPGPPIAVYRTSVGSWPLHFRLDDTQSMIPGRNLSTARRVTVEARISKYGQPLAASGDLEGTSGPVDPSAHAPLKIVIDRVVP